MVFNSFEFLIFFPIVTIIYYIIPKKLKTSWLLIASYYFYMSWHATYAILILLSTIVTYASGLLLEKVNNKKAIVATSFIINLGILFTFKYVGFLIDSLNFVLLGMHLSPISGSLNLLLPVGISFYTFQALGYTVDVYRGDIKAERNFIRYALFVSFFPQLVAGPIERSGNLLVQINSVGTGKKFDYHKFVSGFSMMCYGLFVKMVVADRVSLLVDFVWKNLQLVGTFEAIVTAFAFGLQIYCDFSGYSYIAIGAARVMGFDLMENFNTPFFSMSVAEFWRRWHISLSSWFKDYIYIPLGGNRCSKLKKYRNVMITFLLSGLWHGANWTYVIWGGLNGLYQVISDIFKAPREKLRHFLGVNENTEGYKLGRIICTSALVNFAFIFFRASSIKDAIFYIKALFLKPNPWNMFNESLFKLGLNRQEMNILLIAALVVLIVDLIRYFKQVDFGEFMFQQNFTFRLIVLIVLLMASLVYGEYGINFDTAQFIYFQF